MLVEFTNRRGLQCQSSIALMAALHIPTHNLWSLPVRLPVPHAMDVHCSASTEDTATFQRLKDQLPRVVTVALFCVESFLRSGFYEESIHSLSSGQWVQPAIVSWPDSTAFAAEVGYRRTPHLAKWWVGMAVTGMLSKRSVKFLLGDGQQILESMHGREQRILTFVRFLVKMSGSRSGELAHGQQFQGPRKPWLCSQLRARDRKAVSWTLQSVLGSLQATYYWKERGPRSWRWLILTQQFASITTIGSGARNRGM